MLAEEAGGDGRTRAMFGGTAEGDADMCTRDFVWPILALLVPNDGAKQS